MKVVVEIQVQAEVKSQRQNDYLVDVKIKCRINKVEFKPRIQVKMRVRV